MKATGIVRKIDDLGRVVIPKEIRRTMRIREGDPLEIYTNNDGEVIFKKYSAINEMYQNASQVCEIMHKLSGCPVIVFDRDHVVAVAGVFHICLKTLWNPVQTSSRTARKNSSPLKALTEVPFVAFPSFPQVMSAELLHFSKLPRTLLLRKFKRAL